MAVDVMAEIPPLPTAAEAAGRRTRFVLESALVGVLTLVTMAGVALSYLRG